MLVSNKKFAFAVKFVILVPLSFFSFNVAASQTQGELDGLYIPKKGWAESQELYPGENVTEQLGRYKVVLKRKGWHSLSESEKERVRKKLVIKGVFQGHVENGQTSTPVIDHKFATDSREGAIYSVNDDLFITGAEPCNSYGAVMLNVTEVLKIDHGAGEYQGLQPGGSVLLDGTLNFCTLQNDFEVIPDQGGLCFGTNSDCE